MGKLLEALLAPAVEAGPGGSSSLSPLLTLTRALLKQRAEMRVQPEVEISKEATKLLMARLAPLGL